MERWEGKVAVITGAGVGIGPAIAKKLTEKGVKVVGLSRLPHRIQTEITALKCDVTKEEDVIKAFNHVTEKLGPVHILINNASISRPTSLLEGQTKEWQRVFDVNVMALCVCTREAVKIMRRYDVAGHVIHINSVAGHVVPNMPDLNVYPASKFAVTALTESLRQELRAFGSGIKVTSVSPGLVRSDLQEEFRDIPALQAQDIADAILYVLATGPNVQVHELTLRALDDYF